MKRSLPVLAEFVVLLLITVGCGHYPATVRSVGDVDHSIPSETMVVVVNLPLEDWPRLQKFTGLEHLRVAKELAPEVTDAHLKALSRLKFPRLREVSVAHCNQVTDEGLRSLTNFPSVKGLQLVGTSLTDRGLLVLSTEFPSLHSINVKDCHLLTEEGFLSLTNSKTITEVILSSEPFTQAQVEHIISTLPNINWWTLSDSHHRLDQVALQKLGEARNITIQVADEKNFVRSVTRTQPNK